ncbi:uncharacterized protein ACN2A1_013457 isoform 1-T1 [Glossina fuscipes fuscipes]
MWRGFSLRFQQMLYSSHILTLQPHQQSIATSRPYMSSSSNIAIIINRGKGNDGDGVLNVPPASPAPSISLTLPSPVLTKSTPGKLSNGSSTVDLMRNPLDP